METFTEKEKTILRTLSGKPHTFHAKEILEKFFLDINNSSDFKEIQLIVSSTEEKIANLYTEVEKLLIDEKIIGLVSVNTIYDHKSKIIIKRNGRITRTSIKALEKIFTKEDEEKTIMVEIILPEAHKIHEVMISQLSRFKKSNMLHQNNHTNEKGFDFNFAIAKLLEEGL